MIPRELTFRVFVSSTFSDLVAERNALQEHVFPRLREFCQKNGARFQPIDLRWGVSNEAALDQSTMRICRAEIARCQAVTPRPNFVVLLGDQHGWRPLPDEIPAAEFEALLPHLPADLAKRWYKLDENAVCPLPSGTGLDKGQYVLQPRTGEFKDYDKWFDEVESPLVDAFHRAARELGLPEAARLKYEASATAQEIHDGVFAVPEAREHVGVFLREIRTADGRPLREALPRDAALKDFVDLEKGTHELDRESQDQLDALKQRLRDRLGAERIKTYTARWEGNGASTEHVPRLCADVYRSLRRIIHAQIKRHRAMPPLEEERLHHQEFGQRRARDFTGQAEPLAQIERYLSPTAEPTAPLVVHGASGSGKSALLAKTVADYPSRYAHHQLVFRFIGVTANSTDPRSLLEGLCRELGERYGADNTDLPLDLNKLTVVFRQRLELATAEHPLTLFLDALDQLQVADRPELSWLPDKLPTHVHLVVSAIPGPILDSLGSHLPSARLLELGPMRPEDAVELLQKWLQRAGRRLAPEEQRQAIRAGFTRCGLPLYLRLAFEEAQRWRSYDKPTPPGPDVDGLIERLFHQLSGQLHHEPLLVERAISFLRCSRYGLTEDEILDLLANDAEYWERFLASAHHALPVTDGQQTRRLPIVIWSRLYHDLEPYLSWRLADGTALMVFFHTRFNEVADRQFLHADTVRYARHAAMSTYFQEKADPEHNQSWKGKGPRPFQHVAFHLAGAQRVDELCQALCDLRFVEARCMARQVFELIADYRLAQEKLPEVQADLGEERVRDERARQWTSEIIEYARQWGDRRDRLERGEAVTEPEPQLPEAPPSCQMRLHQGIDVRSRFGRLNAFAAFVGIECYPLLNFGQRPGFVLQHAWASVPDGPVHDAAELLIQTCQSPVLLRRWPKSVQPDPSTGDARASAPYAIGLNRIILEGHERSEIPAVAITPDARLAVSGSWDGTVRLWDPRAGQLVRVFRDYGTAIDAVGISADGTIIVAAGSHGSLITWNAADGRILGRIDCGHFRMQQQQPVNYIALSADGRIVATASDTSETVSVWDLKPFRQSKTFCRQSALGVRGLALAQDCSMLAASFGRDVLVFDLISGDTLSSLRLGEDVYALRIPVGMNQLITADVAGNVCFWNLRTGQKSSGITLDQAGIFSMAVTADGRIAVTGSFDGRIQLWEVPTGKPLRSWIAHKSQPIAFFHTLKMSVDLTADGRTLVSSGWDGTVRIWSPEDEGYLEEKGHANAAIGIIALSGDGTAVLSHSLDGYRDDFESGLTVPEFMTCKVLDTGTGALLRDSRCSKGSLETLRLNDSQTLTFDPYDLRHPSPFHDLPDTELRLGSNNELILMRGPASFDAPSLKFGKHPDYIQAYTLSPCGRNAITGCRDGTLRVWDIRTKRCIAELEGHSNWLTRLAISPDARYAVSGSLDKTLRLWSLTECKNLAVYHAQEAVSAISRIHPNGMVACGTADGQVHLLHLKGVTFSTPIVTAVGQRPQRPPTNHQIGIDHRFGHGSGQDPRKSGWKFIKSIIFKGFPSLRGLYRDAEGNLLAETMIMAHQIPSEANVKCPWCGVQMPVPLQLLEMISRVERNTELSADRLPAVCLPPDTWNSEDLLWKCPNCGRPLRLNPFIASEQFLFKRHYVVLPYDVYAT